MGALHLAGVAKQKIEKSVKSGFRGGLRSALWLTKMMIPITLGVALLKWAGVIDFLSRLLSPAFEMIGLSGQAVIVFLTSTLSNLYSTIAVMATLNLDFRQATILAVMGLICHNLIVETIIQRKAGSNGWFIATLRIVTALVAGFLLNWLLPSNYSGMLMIDSTVQAVTFTQIMSEWAWSMLKLIPMMFVLIVSLNILQQLLREFKLIDALTIPLTPLIKVMGLRPETSFLWIVLNTLGLAYGGGVMIAELDEGQISPSAARELNSSAAITHSLLEDTLIFVAIGLNVVWLIVARMILAIVAVWSQKIYYNIKGNK
ncbi:MAG: nucleoside recognition protein [Mucinivorans sp.]